MAQFREGQRVRFRGFVAPWHSTLNGREGTVLGMRGPHYLVDADGIGPMTPGWGPLAVWEYNLAPILPPDEADDQFIARIKKLATEPVNDAPKVEVMK